MRGPLRHGLLLVLATVLVSGEHGVLKIGKRLVVESHVAHQLSGLREVLLEARTSEAVNHLSIAQGVLGILEVADRERAVGPVRTPQRHRDVTFGGSGLLQLGQHRRR